jgi:hypothetical protein
LETYFNREEEENQRKRQMKTDARLASTLSAKWTDESERLGDQEAEYVKQFNFFLHFLDCLYFFRIQHYIFLFLNRDRELAYSIQKTQDKELQEEGITCTK